MMISKIVALFALLNVSYAQPIISREGEMCGGMIKDLAHTCAKPLECVYTKGPLIADAPGSCKPKCPTKRDAWGNCVPKNCEIWSDGCNTCHFKDNKLTDCSEKKCFDVLVNNQSVDLSIKLNVKDTQLMKMGFFIVQNTSMNCRKLMKYVVQVRKGGRVLMGFLNIVLLNVLQLLTFCSMIAKNS